MNAIDLLKEQHEKVKQTLVKMCAGKGTPAEVKTLADELVAHMVIEEHIFYPRIKEIIGDMFEESFEEHAVARFELARLLQASGPMLKTRAGVLKAILEHHISEEEKEMLPQVKKRVPQEELVRLGTKMLAAFEKAVAKGFAAFFEDAQPTRGRPANGAGMPRTSAMHARH